MNFCVEFDGGVNNTIFSGNEQQIVVLGHSYFNVSVVRMVLRQSTCDYSHVIILPCLPRFLIASLQEQPERTQRFILQNFIPDSVIETLIATTYLHTSVYLHLTSFFLLTPLIFHTLSLAHYLSYIQPRGFHTFRNR